MPVSGKIIRAYDKKKNQGIDISAAAGSAVKAAEAGTVAAVTKDTDQVTIVVIRHADSLLTVYAGIDGLKVKKGDKVSRGQTIGAVRAADPSFLHFEVRKGVDSLDPMSFLQ
jgi:murein DD-endopeptidase MepM/ murein hydrolase activator NlpD